MNEQIDLVAATIESRINVEFILKKILKIEQHSGDFLDIQEIFPTLQGEGPFVGQGAIFIRLGGCNLKCNFCDTEFDSFKNFSLKIFEIFFRL